ncbi:4-demethylwyosine synthase TYW1 [Candidatus Woesearchaeota archaeon]|nr:4-demethylwyosine synthase TYW1 [Candidatus Woesearchaeota archaeon]
MLTSLQKAKAFNQQYRLVGRHSAVKICLWTKQCIRSGKVCYKQEFYGIHTGNCLEMTPAILCNHRCLHCWRDTSLFAPKWEGGVDDPKEIIRGCIDARRELMIGFGGSEKVKADKQKLAALNTFLAPDHAAISLTGEPCLYPRLPELIDALFDDFHFRTVFLVTNGTVPEMLKRIGTESKHFPTNTYLSLQAYNFDSHKKLNHPVVLDTWNKIIESLKYLSTVKDKTRTIVRITVINGHNMSHAREFLPYVKLMKPHFIEVKGYGFLGMSRRRLKEENVPSWEEVQGFAEEIAHVSGYKITLQHEPSDIVQLREK